MDLERLNSKFAIPGTAAFEVGQGGLPRLAVATEECAAHIYPYGAHVTHWQPAGQRPVLFVSAKSWFEAGKPIRGGVPVCFPWFGKSDHLPDAPQHGLARIMNWGVETVEQSGGEVKAAMFLRSNDSTRRWWPHEFELRLTAVFGRQLLLTLEATNTGADAFEFTEALHSYFYVGDVRRASVSGLEGMDYLDTVGGRTPRQEPDAPLRVEAETDRLYNATQTACVIDCPALGRRIVVDKEGSNSTVVWNPWVDKSRAMPDFGDDEWPLMLCIETANFGPDAVRLPPGASHAMQAKIWTQNSG